MIRLDCLGDACPIPIMKLKNAMGEIHKGSQVLLISDCSCTLQAVESYCLPLGLYVKVNEPIAGVWEIEISKALNL